MVMLLPFTVRLPVTAITELLPPVLGLKFMVTAAPLSSVNPPAALKVPATPAPPGIIVPETSTKPLAVPEP